MSNKAAQAAKNVYKGYMPIDLPQHRKRDRVKPWWKVEGRPRVTMYPKPPVETYSEQPEYPPLNDGSRKGIKSQVRLDWYEKLKTLPTAEKKLYEIGKHRSHKIAHIHNWLPGYNSLPMIEYMTNTKLLSSLPDSYSIKKGDENDGDRRLTEQVKKFVLSQVAMDKYESIKESPKFVSNPIRDGNRKSHVSNRLIQNLVSGLRRSLSLEVNPQLTEYQFDLSPAIRSWWYHSGFKPPRDKVFYKSRKDEDGNINQMIQMDGSSALNIRHDSMLEPIIPLTDPLVTDTSLIEKYSYPLIDFGAAFKFKWPVALPGFWFEDEPKVDMPHTSFLSTDCLKTRERKNFKIVKPLDDDETCLNGQAILTAFGWTNSLSMYHGFTPFHEVQYPFTCQTITTDGQNWLFNVYQLNCHSFHRDLGGPGRNNICWSSGKMQLFKDYKDGQFSEINDDVIELLIRFLAQKTSPEYTSQLNLRPLLSADDGTDEDRQTVRDQLRRLYEQRSNKWLLHDWNVPLYEHIFFRSKTNRHRIRHMKPRFHIPKPLPPKIFE